MGRKTSVGEASWARLAVLLVPSVLSSLLRGPGDTSLLSLSLSLFFLFFLWDVLILLSKDLRVHRGPLPLPLQSQAPDLEAGRPDLQPTSGTETERDAQR